MLYLIIALLFFIFSVVVHVLFCRGKRGNILYVKIFGYIALINLSLCSGVFQSISADGTVSIWLLPLKATSIFIYLLLIPAYLVVYVTTQLNSPSKIILRSLSARDGLTIKNLQKNFTDEEFIVFRLQELVKTGCAVAVDGKYRLGASGTLIFAWLRIYQWLLGERERG